MRPTRLVLLLLLAAVTAACENPSSSRAGPPARMDVVSGDMQANAVVGQELPDPLVVKVLDDGGDPVPNQLVNFVVTAGGGTVFAGAAQTNAQGEARERWTLGRVARDTQRVEVRAVDATTGQARVFATFRAVGAPGPAAYLERISPAERTGTAGAPLADSLAVRVHDRYGNVVPGATVTWTVTSGGGAVSSATAVSGPDGVAKTAWTLGAAAGAQAARASLAGQQVDFTAQAGAGAAARVQIVTPPLNFIALAQHIPLVVTGQDQFGNAVAGAQVTLVSLNSAVVSLLSNPVRAASVGNGSTKIVATLQGTGAADTVDAFVRQVASTLQLVPYGAINLSPGNSASRSVQGRDVNFNPVPNPPVTWRSSNPAVATVSSTGVVTAHAVGTAQISAIGEADTATMGAYVAPPPALTRSTIAAGTGFTCALTTAGEAYCWGSNEKGALGTGAGTGSSSTPVEVAGNQTFVDLRAGEEGACALTAAGAVYCWGSVNNSPAPVLMSGGHTFQSVGVGCGITTAGRLRCYASWANPGQEFHTQETFVTVNVYGCGLTVNGDYRCAPGAGLGEILPQAARLGDGQGFCVVGPDGRVSCVSCLQPGSFGPCVVSSPPGTSYMDFAASYLQVGCALTTGGSVHCGGVWSLAPLAGAQGSSFVDITGHSDGPNPAGTPLGRHFCALTAGGQLYCWGDNAEGQLGDGTTTAREAPTLVGGGLTWATPGNPPPGASASRVRR